MVEVLCHRKRYILVGLDNGGRGVVGRRSIVGVFPLSSLNRADRPIVRPALPLGRADWASWEYQVGFYGG